MKMQEQEFSVWPLMIDMLTSLLIIIILFNFFDEILRPENLEQKLVEIRRAQFLEEFTASFNEELRSNKIQIDSKFDYLQITFSDRILFGSGSFQLNPQGAAILGRFRNLIPSNAKNKIINFIQVEGHTDPNRISNSFTFPVDNWDLSAARAIAVVRFLIDTNNKNQVLPSLFSANGFGQFQPVSKDDNKNRRIEIKVYFSDKQSTINGQG
ncbi:MAG: OmpA family protein [Saprospiraceae bacterium]